MTFKPDGCSNAPDLFWRACCDEHDRHYQTGDISRAEADKQFLRCMQRDARSFFGRHLASRFYYYAVRIFGRGYYRPDASIAANSESGSNGRGAGVHNQNGTPIDPA